MTKKSTEDVVDSDTQGAQVAELLGAIAQHLEKIAATGQALLGIVNLHYGKKALLDQQPMSRPVDDEARVAGPVEGRGAGSKKKKKAAVAATVIDDTAPPPRESLQDAVSDAATDTLPSGIAIEIPPLKDEAKFLQLIHQLGSRGAPGTSPSDTPVMTVDIDIPDTDYVIMLDIKLWAENEDEEAVYGLYPVVCQEIAKPGKPSQLDEILFLDPVYTWEQPLKFTLVDKDYYIECPT